ncbi:MAG: nucleotidyltransferase domain-containing protein [Nanoarchaeota archaeon]
MKKIDLVLKEALGKVKPEKEEMELLNKLLKEFIFKLGKNLKQSRLNAEIFVGGSFAKGTIIKKDIYDADIFLRFKKGKENISELTEKMLKGIGHEKVHGSRDYFKVKIDENFLIEIIPVIKIKNPKEAENVTDMSYSHVYYVKKKIKGKILDEIRLAKAFCHANGCYGAESYIKGFSGYALELLVYHYGSFQKFVKAITKINQDKNSRIRSTSPKLGQSKEIIDIEKHFKNKQEILMNLNDAKLQSPIVLIDPTYKQRNVLAALSMETFLRFKKICNEFLKKPNAKFFEIKKTDAEKIKRESERKKLEFVSLTIKTDKQEGDIAGSKLLKFYNHLENEIDRFFEIKKKYFEYNKKESANCFFSVKNKNEITLNGPAINDKKNKERFIKTHKNTFIKKGRIFAKEKINFSLKDFLMKWEKKNRKKMGEMSVSGLEIK